MLANTLAEVCSNCDFESERTSYEVSLKSDSERSIIARSRGAHGMAFGWNVCHRMHDDCRSHRFIGWKGLATHWQRPILLCALNDGGIVCGELQSKHRLR